MNKGDNFWFDDAFILLDKERLTEFFPSQSNHTTLEERLNAIVRLSMYLSLMLYAYHKEPAYLFIFLITCVGSILVYKQEKQHVKENMLSEPSLPKQAEEREDATCTPPTLDNPFMNATMKDYLNVDESNRIIDRPQACDTADPIIKKEMDRTFGHNLFTDVDDLFGKMNSQRQFYTMPSTTIPNKQGEFANWLYSNPKTCKEDQDYCLRYEDIRAKRPVMQNEDVNPV
jgi:hypothetical protein